MAAEPIGDVSVESKAARVGPDRKARILLSLQ
jgi:hypothetical protein